MGNNNSTETVTFELVVDAKKANSEIAAVGEKLAGVDGPAKKLWTSLNTIDGKIVSVGDQFKNLQAKMGPAAAAISGVSSALGQTSGEAGKLIAAGGQMVAAFGSGGPVGVAIVAATLAVNQFGVELEKATKAQDALIAKRFAATDAAADPLIAARAKLAALTATQESTQEAAVEAARQRVAAIASRQITSDAQKKLEGMHHVSEEAALQEQVKTDLAEGAQNRFVATQLALKTLQVELQVLDTIRKQNKEKDKEKEKGPAKTPTTDPAEKYIEGLREAQAARERARAAESEGAAVSISGMGKAGLIGDGGLQGAGGGSAIGLGGVAPMRVSELTQEMKLNQSIAEDWSLSLSSAFNRVGAASDVATSAMSFGIGVTTQLFDDLITGQEDSLGRFTIAIMKQTGVALVGLGTQAVAQGIVQAASVVGAPLAPASFLAGSLLIGTGLAMGAGATAASHLSAGGVIGQQLPGRSASAASTSTGINRGSGAGSASGGNLGTTINITYGGASGPTAEHGAAAVVQALKRSDRRGGR